MNYTSSTVIYFIFFVFLGDCNVLYRIFNLTQQQSKQHNPIVKKIKYNNILLIQNNKE